MDKRSFLFVLLLTVTLFFVNNFLFDRAPTPKQIEQATTSVAPTETKALTPKKTALDNSFKKEEFYLLENEYEQVVFSSFGGAIAELNLSLKSETNQKSVVRPINFDALIAKDSSENNYFPLNPAYKAQASGQIELASPTVGGYTPLLRRSLKDESGKTSFELSPSYYLTNLVTADIDMEPIHFSVTSQTSDSITFVGRQPERTITKTYKFIKDAPYTLELSVEIDGDVDNFWITTGLPEVELVSGTFSPVMQTYGLKGKKLKVEKLSLPKKEETLAERAPVWVSNANGFFGIILGHAGPNGKGVRLKQISGDLAPTRLSLIDKQYNLYPAEDYPSYALEIPFKPVKSNKMTYHLFAGPFSESILKTVDATLSKSNPAGNPSFSKALSLQGWFTFISEPFAAFLFILMKFFHMVTHSWGFSIILLTLVLRILLYPLNSWSFKSNLKMQKLGPKLKAIQDKYKGDTKRVQMETAMLYKTERVNPFSGCLPVLIQLPFLIGMFDLLKSTFALRGVPFIPGWINNLTAPDILFSWDYPIIFFGTSFHLLPLILSGLMYLQSRMNSFGQEQKGPMTDQQKQMKTMGNMMTVVFFFLFYNMPSGLNIYWIFSTLFGILQQWLFINRPGKQAKGPKAS